jgi:glycosyltransferase involved in cell wall biosynthesis
VNRPQGAPVTVLVLTHNEERNLDVCLGSVTGWTEAVFVVDSGSTDRTAEIARAHGATVVAHPFETHARQWRWALNQLPIRTSWVLALDADQSLTPELRDELALGLSDGSLANVDGVFLNRRQIFRGRWIRHGGYYPKYLLKLFRRERVTIDEDDLVDHHFRVSGPTAKGRHDLIEDNRNEADIAAWVAKHNRYAVLQERQETRGRGSAGRVRMSALLENPDRRVRWLKQVWGGLPLFVRPCGYFTYRYLVRLGFLDGREGFIFHVLQAFWYRLLVDINILELRRRGAPAGGDLQPAAGGVHDSLMRSLPGREPGS